MMTNILFQKPQIPKGRKINVDGLKMVFAAKILLMIPLGGGIIGAIWSLVWTVVEVVGLFLLVRYSRLFCWGAWCLIGSGILSLLTLVISGLYTLQFSDVEQAGFLDMLSWISVGSLLTKIQNANTVLVLLEYGLVLLGLTGLSQTVGDQEMEKKLRFRIKMTVVVGITLIVLLFLVPELPVSILWTEAGMMLQKILSIALQFILLVQYLRSVFRCYRNWNGFVVGDCWEGEELTEEIQ
ncbi:MAG: hypothetical protein ACOX60_05470 [Massiliimalia sp.]|jgi:uncharacterized membrane protein